jgi:TonB family protein
MSLFVLSAEGWSFNEQADARFKRITTRLLIIFVILAVAIPFLELVGVQEGGGETTDTTYVNILPDAQVAEQVEEPKPAEENEPEPEPVKEVKKPEPKEQPAPKRPEPKPEPTQEQLEQAAREVAKQSGINALADELADLRDNSLSGLDAARPLSDEVISARPGAGGGGSASIASSAASGSGGIGTASATSPRTQSGAGLGTRRTTVVQAPKGVGPDMTKPGQSGNAKLAGRTLEEIQLVFDRNKASFYSMFNRALRENPDLRGKVVVRLTIAPNGSVTACELVSSELGDPDLEQKVVQRVKLLNFGAKNVPEFTYPNYPIVFLPT